MLEDLADPPTPGNNPLVLFENLVPRFRRLRATARRLSTPNPEDDLCVRLAIVGFSQNAQTELWSYRHFQRLQIYRRRELNSRDLSGYGEEAAICEQFSCLAYGSLLGLREAGTINDTDLMHSEAVLPAFLIQRAGRWHPLA